MNASSQTSEAGSGSDLGREQRTITISLTPVHSRYLRLREKQTGLGKSSIVRTYLELDERDDILAVELARRVELILSKRRKNGGTRRR